MEFKEIFSVSFFKNVIGTIVSIAAFLQLGKSFFNVDLETSTNIGIVLLFFMLAFRFLWLLISELVVLVKKYYLGGTNKQIVTSEQYNRLDSLQNQFDELKQQVKQLEAKVSNTNRLDGADMRKPADSIDWNHAIKR